MLSFPRRLIRFLRAPLKQCLIAFVTHQCKREYVQQEFRWVNERPIEYGFAFEKLAQLKATDILDVGTGDTALPHLLRTCGYIVTAIDNIRDYWPRGMVNRHWLVLDDDIRSPRIQRRFDVVTCISVLEHIHEHRLAVQNICRLLRQGGYLILTVPYNERSYISNIYEAPEASYGKENPYICQVFSRKEIDQWVQANPFQVLEQQYWRVFSGDYWTFGKQIYPRVMVTKNERHQLACLLLQKKNVAAGGDLAG